MTRLDPKRPGRRWDALALTLPAADADEICGLLSPITCGVEWEVRNQAISGALARVKIYLRPGAVAGARDFAAGVLTRFGLVPAACDPQIEVVEDGRWVERYQAQLLPFDLGQRFTVLPSGDGTAGRGRVGLPLVPGRAFGTGEHPTTRLCTVELEHRVQRGSRWLDVGCGTAILSIVARHCGAGSVLALDNDPDAGEVAREVLATSGIESGIEVRLGTLDDVGPETFDGVVANISAPFFTEAAGELAAHLVPGGVLIASGFITDTAPGVEAALERAGLTVREREGLAPWVVLIAERAR